MADLKTRKVAGPEGETTHVPLDKVEAALGHRLKAAGDDVHGSVRRARMSNLIIYCSEVDRACHAEALVPEIVALHPARVILLVAEARATTGDVTASVLVRRVDGDDRLVSEQVTLHAGGPMVDRLPSAVRGLLIGDLPTNLWWACSTPPPTAGPLLAELADHAQQVIYDSLGWADPNRAVAATSDWLERFERGPASGRWRIASDLNWRRLKTWRRLLTQGLDPVTAPGLLAAITEVVIEHGPHAVTQAWQLAGWLASRLGWAYREGQIRDQSEIAIRFDAPHGPVALRIDRLPDGLPQIRRVRFAGGGGALEFAAESADRLAVIPQGDDARPRTVAVPGQKAAELIGRQLSDREPDPVFRESMKVAQQLARHVVGS